MTWARTAATFTVQSRRTSSLIPVRPWPARFSLELNDARVENKEGYEARRAVAMSALSDMISYYSSGGQVGIYDATNSTESVRRMLLTSLNNAGISKVRLNRLRGRPRSPREARAGGLSRVHLRRSERCHAPHKRRDDDLTRLCRRGSRRGRRRL